jgi:hypothetical protein
MVHVTECKFEQLVGQDATSISEANERMVSKDSPQAHGSAMKDGLLT